MFFSCGTGCDVDLHRRLGRELHLPEVAEHDLLLLARVDQVDRLRLDDRRRRLLDRQRHLDLYLLRVAGVLDRDREAEIGGGGDRVLRGLRELLVGGQGGRLDDPGAVQAAARAAAGGGGALEPLQDRLPVAAARVVRAGDELRAGNGDAGDPFAFEHAAVALRRRLEEVAPDHVAGRRGATAGGWRSLSAFEVTFFGERADCVNPSASPRSPLTRNSSDSSAAWCWTRSGPGRMDRPQGGDVLLLALGEAVQLLTRAR